MCSDSCFGSDRCTSEFRVKQTVVYGSRPVSLNLAVVAMREEHVFCFSFKFDHWHETSRPVFSHHF